MATTTRICRTPEECFEAGWQACEDRGDRLTPAKAAQLAAIVRPYLRRDDTAA